MDELEALILAGSKHSDILRRKVEELRMKSRKDIEPPDARAVYDGGEGELFELLMGEQIHVGGLDSSVGLADAGGIGTGQSGVDLCCCNGAGMRFLVRFRGVASMTGVDISETVVERGRQRCATEGSSERIRFVLADACESGLPSESADFIWGEDAWVYVPDKPRLISEAARIVKPGGTIAFTEWVEGPAGLAEGEAEQLLRSLRLPNIQDIPGYTALLEKNDCHVLEAVDTGRFADSIDLYIRLIETQFKYDALQILGFDAELLLGTTAWFRWLAELARADKIAQARFVARRH